ncbi:MAG: outer membrane lipoprotein LolB [Gammaproteobacteria bacterium]|nr:outer membrane lipoprotein LolB [Gammaproteobacteria bacterium]
MPLALLLALTAGCALQPPRPPGTSEPDRTARWQRQVAEVGALEQWIAVGRVSIRQGRQGWNAGLQWAQTGTGFRLRIMAPLAQGTWQIEGSAEAVAMTTPQQEYLLAADVETLLQTQLGWSLPVDGVRYWLTGIPDPARSYELLRLNDEGLLQELEQGDWHIVVQEYQTACQYLLPRRLTLERTDLSLRLAVTQWQVP